VRALLLAATASLLSPGWDTGADHRERCGRLAASVTIRTGAELTPGDELRGGRIVACVERPELATLLVAVESARAAGYVRPIVVHTELRWGRRSPLLVAYHRSTGTLLAGGATRALDETVWLHELAHKAMDGTRPAGALAARLVDAVEEGAADYFAAALSGRPSVGSLSGGERRDLVSPAAPGASEWAALAVPGAFSSHRFGAILAAQLLDAEPRPGELLRDLIQSLGDDEPWPAASSPRAVVDELVRRSPLRSRRALEAALLGWLPRELARP